jgi:outer membrane protein TolC
MMRPLFILAIISLITFSSLGQSDLRNTLSIDEFVTIVKANHPIAKQAELKLEYAEGFERKAKGAFDPKLEANNSSKFYDGTNYYNITNGSLKIPTRSPLSLKAGYDYNYGEYVDDMYKVPKDGLFSAGVSLSLLQGLIIDERRAQLQIADAFTEFSDAERRGIYNELMYDAYNAYWSWWNAFEKTEIAGEMVTISQTRFDAVKERALAGDRPLIDTVEAYMQVQIRRQSLIDAMINEVKARYFVSGYLWKMDNTVLQSYLISENTIPRNPEGQLSEAFLTLNTADFSGVIEEAHPVMNAYSAKLDQLNAELKWKREKMKPKLDLDYNLLSQYDGVVPQGSATDNYKFGLTFSFPIFMREARGDVQMGQVKINETDYQRELKLTELKNKAAASYQNVFLIQQQLTIAQQNVTNYSTLLEAERTRFFNGESSLFIVNQRESALADARNKVVDLQSKLEIATAEVLFYLGKL